MPKTILAPAAVLVALMAGCATAPRGLGSLETVPKLDPARYAGRWYEIARFPQSFEKELVGVTAEYGLKPDGSVSVLNSGFKRSLDGKYAEARAVARIPDPAKPGRLKVSFFRPFWADYLVFGLDEENYSWALVGDDSRKYLWFLARNPEVDADLLARMKSIAESRGYDLSRLQLVPQKAR